MLDSLIGQKARERLESLRVSIDKDYQYYIGFPGSLDFDYRELMPFLGLFLNNIGDPGISTWHGLHTKDMEQEVLNFFARLFRAPKDEWWGYVTSGSTECNLYALYAGRQKYPQASVFYSTAAHYSIPKNLHILGQTGVAVHVQPNGEMDYTDLGKRLSKQRGKPVIVVATVGTTMTEARDDVIKIRQQLSKAGISDYFIHVDGALAGTYAALLKPRHAFDFEDGADSLNISGHKFIGSPVPSGVVLIRKAHRERLAARFNYTGSVDTTISGSRSGHTTLLLWYALERWGMTGLRRRAVEAQKMADYTLQQLQAIGWNTWRNPGALTVMLESPSSPLIAKWQLATWEGWSHVICMPGIVQDKLDAFVADLKKDAKTRLRV